MYKVESTKTIIEGKEVDTYGISNGENFIEDISSNLEFVEALAYMLNEYDVSDVHFKDVVEDSIIDEEYFLSIAKESKFKPKNKD